MLARSSVFRSDLFKTFVQYLSVGLAFVPAGAAYAYIVVTHGESLPALLILLTVGFIMAQLAWRRTELAVARWGVHVAEETAAPTVFVVSGQAVGTAPVFRYAVFAMIVFTSRISAVRGTVGDVGTLTMGDSHLLTFTTQ